MLDLLDRDVATMQPRKCCVIKKHGQDKVKCGNNTCMALLTCNNHFKVYSKWGDVPLN